MTLVKTVQADYLAARYAKDTLKSNLLSTLLGEAQTVGKGVGNRDATDDEIISLIKKFIKNAEATSQAALNSIQLNKMDIIQRSADEVKILSEYLPKQLDLEDIKLIIARRANEGDNMGAIMNYFKTNYAGQYDGKLVSTWAKEMLA